MAVNSRSKTELSVQKKKWQDRETSPERTKIWIEPKLKTDNKVPLIYYLSRNGQLDHPHFTEVPLSSSKGLYLRDVINRLNSLRGKGMASMYSWSSKRVYRNGFVWQDLSENDLICPTQGREYVLKGSELLQSSVSLRYHETTASLKNLPEIKLSSEDCDFPATMRRRNQSWSSFDPQEYRVYKVKSGRELTGKAADVSTQTEDSRQRRRSVREVREECEKGMNKECGESITELSRGDISPPVSISSVEGMEGVSGSRGADLSGRVCDRTAENMHPSGRMKASQALMKLISCGSVPVNDCESIKG
ncbi:protein SOSEKI 5-like [Cornus florida]|uniref:protein SOSEKI 5-like n=1 Tax=Cornus florida TaxID=4283 RepID=UPI0028998FFE|nr:protein SOSEKI 5-like [Cornus florida]